MVLRSQKDIDETLDEFKDAAKGAFNKAQEEMGDAAARKLADAAKMD